MKKFNVWSLVALISVLLFTGCPGPNNNDEPEDKSSKIEVLSQKVGMSYIQFDVKYTGSDIPKSWDINLYKSDDLETSLGWEYETDKKMVSVRFDNRAYNIVDADTEYKVKILMQDSNWSKSTKTITITTKPKGSPEITKCEYNEGTKPYVTVSYDEAPNFVDKLELLRSEAENGEYTNVNETTFLYGNLEITDNSIEDNKTYYFKLKAYENKGTSSEPDYELLGESSVKSVATGYAIPSKVDVSKITFTKGIKSFTVTWPETEGALKYNIWLQKYRSSSYKPEEGDVIEEYEAGANETSYQFKNLKPETTYDFYIKVTTAGGTSEHGWISISTVKPGFKKETWHSYNYAKVTSGQDKATYMPELTFNEFDDCEFYLSLRKDSSKDSEVLYGIDKVENTSFFIVEGLSPATEYSRTYSSKNPSGYIHLTVKYTDEEGEEKTVTDYIQADTFKTKGLDAPTNVQFVSSTANTATISFDEITTEQKFGKEVRYVVSAYDSEDNLKSSGSGSTSPVTVSGLQKGQNYRFVVNTTFTGAVSYVEQDTATCYGATESGITVKPVIAKLSEVPADEFHRGIRTNIQVKFDELEVEGMDSADFVYGIEYKLFEKSSFKPAKEDFIFDDEDEFIKLTSANAVSGTFTQKILVNAGNKYKVRLSAYNTEDPSDVVYSDVEEIQLAGIDDSVTFAALLYPEGNTIGAKAGEMVEFTNPKVWEKETEIRSTRADGYKIGYIQLMGEIESTKILFPKSTGVEWVAAKFNFKDALNAENIPRIILIDRCAFPFASNAYGYFDEVYITMPNEQATIIEEFKDDTENSKYIFKDFNMPYFDAETQKTSTAPSEAGMQIKEEWVYNNSIYLGVKQTIPGNLGFSYYY